MRPKGVSIIICCHNGASRLQQTIRHIARQHVPWYIPWEVLIIDNGSTDDSMAIARKEWRRNRKGFPLRIVHEPVLGLSHARVRGFRDAYYEFMIMCDDDNWLDRKYVASAYRIMSEEGNIGALGGFGKLVFEVDPPVAELSYIFAAGAQADHSGKVKDNRLYGAGCVIRHSAYQKLLGSGFKSLLTDRKGAELTSGGDYELCLALAMMGYDVWYDERLRFTHYITAERLTWEYFLKYAYESSKSFNVISSYKMVLANGKMRTHPWLALSRNLLVCWKIFMTINLERLLTRPKRRGCSLYFRHLIFKYKLMAYFVKFREMVIAHRHILEFRDRCRPLQHVLKPAAGKPFSPAVKVSFFSKPFRQLP